MRERIGYVSNSSSASFILQKSKMTKEQIEAIRDLRDHDGDPYYDPEVLGPDGYDIKINQDYWHIVEDAEFIRGDTIMDNDGLHEYLTSINLADNAIVNWACDG